MDVPLHRPIVVAAVVGLQTAVDVAAAAPPAGA